MRGAGGGDGEETRRARRRPPGRLEIFIRDHEHDELGISGARTREERDVRRERGADGDADG